MNGFLNIYKPKGITSAKCLNKVKSRLSCKCGHMGTLDPLAFGVLPVAIGQATRLFDHLVSKKKEYMAEFTFGYETDTLDMEGKTVNTCDKIPDKAEVLKILPKFCGKIMQSAPVYSAKCVDGKKSYNLARAGKEVILPPKEVEIFSLELLSSRAPSYVFRIECGGGTYIRSLCRDMAHSLKSFATMTSLERVKSGFFTKENSVGLEEFLESSDPFGYIIPSDAVLPYEKLCLSEEKAERILNGLFDDYNLPDDKYYRVYCGEKFLGVGFGLKGELHIKPYVRD